MQTRPTMQKIADEMGLSRLTVSSVVNDRAEERGISPATAARVSTYLAERGYVPSRRARDLRAKAAGGVGLIHSGRLYSHLTEAFNRLADAAADTPGRLEIMVVRRPDLIHGVRELVARGVSKVVWIQARSPTEEFSAPYLLNYLAHVRTVIYNYRFGEGELDRSLLERGLDLVGIDRAAGYRKLARFLRRLGHAVVALAEHSPAEGPRGPFERAFLEAGSRAVPCHPKVPAASPAKKIGRSLAEVMLGAVREEGATAACFHDDEIAGHAMAELLRRGVRIPEDLTVTGFDGIAVADAFAVPLTTLRVPVARMVERVREILARPRRPRRHRFEPELVRAGSHARPPRLLLRRAPSEALAKDGRAPSRARS